MLFRCQFFAQLKQYFDAKVNKFDEVNCDLQMFLLNGVKHRSCYKILPESLLYLLLFISVCLMSRMVVTFLFLFYFL